MSLRPLSPRPLLDDAPIKLPSPAIAGIVTAYALCYSIYGSGPQRLVLLMAANQPKSEWKHQIIKFSADQRYSVLAIDLPGAPGGPPKFNIPVLGFPTTDKMSRILVSALRELKWTSRLNLIGLALGGCCAMKVALLTPSWIESIVLISAQARFKFRGKNERVYPRGAKDNSTGSQKSRTKSFLRAIGGNAGTWSTNELRIMYPSTFINLTDEDGFNTNDKAQREIARRQNRRKHPLDGALKSAENKANVAGQAGSVLGHGIASLTHRVTRSKLSILKDGAFKKLVIAGDLDESIAVEDARALADSLNCKLYVVDGAGHFPAVQMPVEVNHILGCFLEDVN